MGSEAKGNVHEDAGVSSKGGWLIREMCVQMLYSECANLAGKLRRQKERLESPTRYDALEDQCESKGISPWRCEHQSKMLWNEFQPAP